MNLESLMMDYAEAKAAAEAAKEAAEEAKGKQQEAEAALVAGMLEEGVTGAKDALDRSFSLKRKVRYSCPADCRAQMLEELARDGLEELFTVNPNTLSSTMAEMVAENDGMLPERYGFIREFEQQTIQMRKK